MLMPLRTTDQNLVPSASQRVASAAALSRNALVPCTTAGRTSWAVRYRGRKEGRTIVAATSDVKCDAPHALHSSPTPPRGDRIPQAQCEPILLGVVRQPAGNNLIHQHFAWDKLCHSRRRIALFPGGPPEAKSLCMRALCWPTRVDCTSRSPWFSVGQAEYIYASHSLERSAAGGQSSGPHL